MNKYTKRGGFTLIELLLVIGIIAILAAIVIVAINPTKQLGDARNAQRKSDTTTLLNAVYQYSIDNNGNFPKFFSGAVTRTAEVCNTGTLSGATAIATINTKCTGSIVGPALNTLVPTYLVGIPKDPRRALTDSGTNYLVTWDAATKRITVSAPGAENSLTISVTR